MESIEIILEGGRAPAGINREALIENIQAEVDKIAKKEKAESVAPRKKPPPAGAQGDASSVHWLLDVIQDPAMARVYAKALIIVINLILEAAKPKKTKVDKTKKPADKKDQKTKSDKDDNSDGLRTKLTVLGKEIVLPATSAVIKEFLKQLGQG